jgi:hypothetical protein
MTATTIKPLRRLMREEAPEWTVWVLIAVMLVIGLLVRTIVENRVQRIAQGSVTLQVPVGWTHAAGEDPSELLHVSESLETTLFPAGVRVLQMPVSQVSTTAQALGDVALAWSNQQSQNLLGYQVLAIEPTKLRDAAAVKIDYAYVAEPPLGGANTIPVVARAEDVLLRNGDTITIATFAADSSAYDDQSATWQKILASLDVK